MKRILLTIMVVVAGLSTIAPDASAQTDNRNTGSAKRQRMMDQWHKDMAEFRARSAEDRQLHALADSLAMLNSSAPNDQVIKLKAIEAMEKMADGQATKIIIPSEIQGLVGLANGLVEGAKQ